MTKDELKIVFFGTPDFAVESLRRLVNGHYNIVGVVTMPDKPAGRGHHLLESDVKKYAAEQGLRLLQPVNLKDETFVSDLRGLGADLFIVIAFRMLPRVVWQMPRLGTFNLHASLLPKYRGAAPINWAVMNGDTRTGVTTFFLKHEIDTVLGADMVLETVDAIIAGTVHPIPQDQLLTAGEQPTPAPKIFKDTCRIDWTWPAERIYNHIRGLSPYPAAWTVLADADGQQWSLKLFATSQPLPLPCQMQPGEVIVRPKLLAIAGSDGLIEVKSLQPAGKKRMTAEEFVRGLRYNGELRCN